MFGVDLLFLGDYFSINILNYFFLSQEKLIIFFDNFDLLTFFILQDLVVWKVIVCFSNISQVKSSW